ncbi:hypothetical protein B7R54_01035 [Subtercola boreus]|uniref:Phosphatidic acid phosphatase type 2/haloperoxidase domain-containing protein n=1 Tax=Subtercola boreus TaxID=120213 RepID=A0A3E0VDG4_9MICO|nr:phosphatase PAP2 family protein [Subtercola boreus]RFA07954.1 hypothetical protein B7R54_01035 [Subtercola boreus]TQL55182.1 5'-phosphoribosyl-monophospho-decaprenol phosphatase [Subtercola boreus]
MTSLRASETRLIVTVQQWPVSRAAVPVARLMSLFGEHAAGWILLGLVGAVLDEPRRFAWLAGVLAVVVAHGVSIVVKRLVRRLRPGIVVRAGSRGDSVGGYASSDAGPVKVYATAPSKLSFPSSHASSTMAAVIVYTALLPLLWPVALLVVVAMGFSRVILGMHFVTDVLAGFGIGILVGVPTALLTA